MHRPLAALTIAVVALLGATACAAAPATPTGADLPGDNGQSTADACAIVQQNIEDATAQFEGAASADPSTVVEAMQGAATQLADSATQITNDEVAALVPSLQEMFVQVADVMDAIVKGDVTKVDDLSELGTQLQSTSTAFQELCDA